MLTDQEQRSWNEVEQKETRNAGWACDADPGSRRTTPRALDDVPGPVLAAVWAGIFLVLFGARVAGLAVLGLTVSWWLLWRYRPSRLTSRRPR